MDLSLVLLTAEHTMSDWLKDYETMVARRTAAFLVLLLLHCPALSSALADDLMGKPALSMATRWKFTAFGSVCGELTRLRARNFAAARTLCNIGAARRLPMIWMPALRGVRSTVSR